MTSGSSDATLPLVQEDIDFDRALIRVRRSYYRGKFGPPKSGRSERVLHMTETVRQELMRYRSAKPSQGLVFPGRSGMPYEPATIVAKVFKRVAAKLELPPFTWRGFRRSASTTMQEIGVPVRSAQEILGHSSPQTTLGICTEATDASQRQAIQTLDRLLFPNREQLWAGLQWLACMMLVKRQLQCAPVAQLDRAADFESVGRGFESLQARHSFQ